MLVQAVVLVVTVPHAFSAASSAPAVETSPRPERPTPPAPTTSSAEPVRVLVIGDSYTVGSAEGGVGAANWTALAGEELDDVALDVRAEGGRGYVSTGPAGGDFLDLAERAGGGYDVVVVFGSRNDRAPRAEVRRAADRLLAALEESSPGAELLVIGPPWVDAAPPAFVRASNRAVGGAAAAADATYVDPLAEGWFTGAAGSLIGRDRIHPTNAGHAYLAQRILPSLRAAVQRARS